jgi:hypothetical protein
MYDSAFVASKIRHFEELSGLRVSDLRTVNCTINVAVAGQILPRLWGCIKFLPHTAGFKMDHGSCFQGRLTWQIRSQGQQQVPCLECERFRSQA